MRFHFLNLCLSDVFLTKKRGCFTAETAQPKVVAAPIMVFSVIFVCFPLTLWAVCSNLKE